MRIRFHYSTFPTTSFTLERKFHLIFIHTEKLFIFISNFLCALHLTARTLDSFLLSSSSTTKMVDIKMYIFPFNNRVLSSSFQHTYIQVIMEMEKFLLPLSPPLIHTAKKYSRRKEIAWRVTSCVHIWNTNITLLNDFTSFISLSFCKWPSSHSY